MTRQEIAREFKGKNFMTPKILRYGQAGNVLYELSYGTGIYGDSDLYGVTVLEKQDGKWVSSHAAHENFDDVLSQVFYSREEAETHIKTLAETVSEEGENV